MPATVWGPGLARAGREQVECEIRVEKQEEEGRLKPAPTWQTT